MPHITRVTLTSLVILVVGTAAHAVPRFHQEPNAAPELTQAAAAPAVAPQTKSGADEFWAALRAPGGVAKARQIYDDTRKKDKKAILFAESDLNQFGYEVLQEGRAKDAIVIFQMNVDEYPASANTYDSLSDAYLGDGKTAEALKFAERALEKLAADTTAPDELKAQIRTSAEAKVKQLKKG